MIKTFSMIFDTIFSTSNEVGVNKINPVGIFLNNSEKFDVFDLKGTDFPFICTQVIMVTLLASHFPYFCHWDQS